MMGDAKQEALELLVQAKQRVAALKKKQRVNDWIMIVLILTVQMVWMMGVRFVSWEIAVGVLLLSLHICVQLLIWRRCRQIRRFEKMYAEIGIQDIEKEFSKLP